MVKHLRKYFLVYIAFFFTVFSLFNYFMIGAFNINLINSMFKNVVVDRILFALLGVVGLFYVFYDRFVISKGNC